MKIRYQKIAAYFLLLLTISPVAFGVYLHLSQIIIQFEMREKLEEENLVTIDVNISEVHWTRKGKEARINGNLFDVEKYRTAGDRLQLTGLFGKDEDLLITQIENTQKNNSDNSNNSVLVFQLLGCFSSYSKEAAETDLLFSLNKLHYCALANPIIISAELSNDTPPPKPTLPNLL